DRLAYQLMIGWIAGTLTSALGLVLSFALDLPTGATMVCSFGSALALAGLLHPFIAGAARTALRRMAVVSRWVLAAVLAGSGLLLVTAPRADQPLLDAAEYMIPSLHALYFTAQETQVYADAQQYAERYRLEAEQLNARETRSRSQGEALDDAMVAR